MFGDILRDLRLDAGLSQEELAQKFNISSTAISKYETGEREPNFDLLIKLSDYFNVSTDYLLGRTRVSTPSHLLNDLNRHTSESLKKLNILLLKFKRQPKYIDLVFTLLNNFDDIR